MDRSYSRRRVLIGLLISVLLIALFGTVIYLIERHGLLDEQFGDTGGWGSDEEQDEILLTFNDEDYISKDSVNAYVVAGTDAGGVDQGEGFNGELADFITVLVVDNTNKKYGFFPINRNTMLDIMVPNKSGDVQDFAYQQIATAHYYGKTADERNEFLETAAGDAMGGLLLDGYFVMNMGDIGKVNDAIGGVDVKIDTDMTDLDPAFKAGTTVHLKGKQAENYLRARTGVGEGTNAERMQRQQTYMENAYSMVISQLRENPEYINDLYDQLTDVVESDGESKLSKITAQLSEYENVGFLKIDGTTRVGVNEVLGDNEEHEEFYPNEDSLLAQMRKVMNIEKAPEESEDEDADDEEDEFEDEDEDLDYEEFDEDV